MDVRDAVATRYSCRAFLPKPVPEKIVRDIVERALRSPSGGNIQPWKIHALAGARLEGLKDLIRPRLDELPEAEGTEYPIFPPGLGEPFRGRRFAVGEQLYESISVARGDRAARLRHYGRNFALFDAPVGLFFSIHRSLDVAQWSDLGSLIQTVMLLARGYGLHTCPQEAWASWHRTVSTCIGLDPDLDAVLRDGAGLRRRQRCGECVAFTARARG